MEDIESLRVRRLSKIAYLFGCVAPDINCIYPAHNIWQTPKRYQKRLERAINANRKIWEAFTLGVITHYTCDYFCLAHNNHSYGTFHTIYEKKMSAMVRRKAISLKPVEPLNIELAFKYGAGNSSESIFSALNKLHDTYLDNIKNIGENWYTNINQMKTDVEWAVSICNELIHLLLNIQEEQYYGKFKCTGIYQSI